MRAGQLRTRVTIEERVPASPNKSSTGLPLTAWATYATVPAAVEPIMGRAYFEAQTAGSKIDTRIRIRYELGVTDEVDESMRVSCNGVIYDINSVINVNMLNRELILMCVSGANLG